MCQIPNWNDTTLFRNESKDIFSVWKAVLSCGGLLISPLRTNFVYHRNRFIKAKHNKDGWCVNDASHTFTGIHCCLTEQDAQKYLDDVLRANVDSLFINERLHYADFNAGILECRANKKDIVSIGEAAQVSIKDHYGHTSIVLNKVFVLPESYDKIIPRVKK